MIMMWASIEEAKARMGTRKCTYRVCIPGQEVKWVYGESMPELLEDGSMLWHGYIVEISERSLGDDDIHPRLCLANTASTWSCDAHRPATASHKPRSIPASSSGDAR